MKLPQSESNTKITADYNYKISDNTSIVLDLIRAVAAQLVLIGHGISFFGMAKGFEGPWIQNIAVLVFFILSGFLITYSTFRKKNRSGYGFTTYAIERFGRIYSGYLPAIVFVILIDFIFIRLYGNEIYSFPLDIRTLLGNLFQLQDFRILPEFLSVTSLGSARPFWTIAIEWWIYIFFGAMVFCDFSFKGILKYSPAFILGGMVAIFNSVHLGRGNGLFLVWLMGAALAFLCTIHDKFTLRKNIMISGGFLIAGCVRVLWVGSAYDLAFAAFLTGSLFFLIRSIDRFPFSPNLHLVKLIRFSANYSFTLYLVHYSILFFMVTMCETWNIYLTFVTAMIVSNIIAAAIALATEMKHKEITSFLLKKSGIKS